jgi:hypothetical protein
MTRGRRDAVEAAPPVQRDSRSRAEQVDTILVDAINNGDLEAAIALYEPNARFVQESGEVVTGHPAIREEMKDFLALKPKFSIKVTEIEERNLLLRSRDFSHSRFVHLVPARISESHPV